LKNGSIMMTMTIVHPASRPNAMKSKAR
jgi:hypothetical protein